MPRLTVSIVLHRTPSAQLHRALQCLLREPECVERIYLVDNSPVDSLRRECSRYLPEKVDYQHVENRGYGAGHNRALRRALLSGADYHLVMNADVEWDDSDLLRALLQEMESRREIAMLQPRIHYPDGELQLCARRLPTPFDLVAKRFLPGWLTRGHMEKYLLARADHEREINSPYLTGSFMLLRAEALRSIGIFDERFFMYPEDIDLTRRLHRRYKTLYWPHRRIVHAHAAASRRSGRMLRIHMANMARYFRKYGWLFDPERRRMNHRLQQSLTPTREPHGRG